MTVAKKEWQDIEASDGARWRLRRLGIVWRHLRGERAMHEQDLRHCGRIANGIGVGGDKSELAGFVLENRLENFWFQLLRTDERSHSQI